MTAEKGRHLSSSAATEILTALERLDARLRQAVAAFDAVNGGPIVDRFRGLYIAPEQARALLTVPAAQRSSFAMHAAGEPLWIPGPGTLHEHLASQFALGPFELDALLIAFAPEFDLRYERLYAYLQDDVTRRRPTVDFILNLLCSGVEERLARRAAFASDGALLRHALVHLVSDPNQVHPPLLAQYVKPDEQIVRFLIGDGGMDSRLAAGCRIVRSHIALSALAVSSETRKQLAKVVGKATIPTARSCLWLHGRQGTCKSKAAEAIAHEAGAALLTLDASRVPFTDLEVTLRLALREAQLRRAFLHVARTECWLCEPQAAALIARATRPGMCTTIFTSTEFLPAEMLGIALPVSFPVPEAALRARCWHTALGAREVKSEDAMVAALAARFRLTPAQISAAVADAVLRTGGQPDAADLLAAARAQSGHALASVATRIEPRATWDDIVLPPDAVAQLQELCGRVDQRERVLNEWGFARKLLRGRGTTALFSGGSGTGKTMAAEVIANALGLHLYRIDLARIVSKYIGETEKNLDRVFEAAESANAILLFDEADALFGKRSEVKDAHDRYANIEISYLLQKMEEYDGVAILATNLADNLDEAFARRLAFHIYFPFPDEVARLQIWQRAWPSEMPIADTVDRKALARELKLAGGSIRNIALCAAFVAAGNGGRVEAAHVLHAVRREHQKAGRASTLGRGFGEQLAQHATGAGKR
ncbi:MAG TPA: ATP-binding protein [Burkholderiales bacterium]|nr:ATP-binding protein [Burkholderiales bacterium]